ncbi:hypothetical protein GCM10009127_14100 [Alteraurantiacibacter aestuarii]|uniref:DUF8021 domain-containing protein n=1 Tax=Alteraurantiacibacter aestuarii TaxID=650004 RepID=A0A844ZLS7_9SPHN|nr:hypothetical protein [Alteraurantiacibacter aestuarii]MXO88000.1 hypothetical protein [Alteraurantiacibacter aestuarii]
MLKKLTTIAAHSVVALAALAISAPAMAQNGPPPSPFAPLQDHPTCDRDQLKAATTAFVEAQRSGDTSALPLASNAHYLQNMETVEASAGLWNTALPIAHAMSFHDDRRCKTFTEIIVTEGGHPYVIGTRLYMHDGEIIRVDSIVTEQGDWLFNANAYLLYTQRENWGPLTPYQRTSPSEMIRGANAYLDGFADKFTDIPWGTPCARLEGGAYTNREGRADASCEVGMPGGVLYIVNRDYLIDEELGVINVFCRFGGSTGGPDSHSFRYIDGKFRQVHTLTAIPGPQANDEGGMMMGQADPNA